MLVNGTEEVNVLAREGGESKRGHVVDSLLRALGVIRL